MMSTKGLSQSVTLRPKSKPFGRLHMDNDSGSLSQPASSITILEKGNIAATYFSFSQGYISDRSKIALDFLCAITHQLFPQPLVEVKGSPDVDISVNRIQGKLAVNLVNTAGPHADLKSPIHDLIPQVGPLTVSIRTDTSPARITMQPDNIPMEFRFSENQVIVTVPRLDIHSILVIE
jgi:hypothetical protein